MARVMSWYAMVAVLLAAVYAAVPPARPAVIGAAALGGVAAIEAGVRRWRPQRVSGWRCLQVALVLLAAGDILFYALEVAAPAPVPYPAASDLVTLAGYVTLGVALFWLGRPTAPQREETSLIDAISLTLAGSLIVWLALVRPIVESQELDIPGRLTAVIVLLAYNAVLAASVRLVLGWRRNSAVILLGIALVWFLLSELLYGYQIVRGGWAAGGPVDLGFLALAAGCGAAALTRSMRDVAPPASGRHSLTPWRLVLIAVGLLVAPAVLVIEALRGPVETGMAIASVGALVSVLILVRLSMSGRAYQARAGRERAVRIASQAMVSAVTPADVVNGTRNALSALVSAHGVIDLDLVRQRDLDLPALTVVPTDGGRRGTFAVPLVGSESALVFSAPVRILTELGDLLNSLANQAAVAIQRINLAEVAHAEERERYFRSLVLTSTDAILISRNGRVEYATPSADTIFGRTIVGERFDEIVRPTATTDSDPQWSDVVHGAEGTIRRPDGDQVTVVIHRRDLTQDPAVRGIVTTLRDVTAERALQRDLAYRASHDDLTGMANARAWGETLSAETDRRRGPGNGVAVIFIDLDEFKSINDRFGHPTGDRVLSDMARRIQECVRTGDLAARVGGDEFAVLLRGLPHQDDARVVAQRLAESLSRPTIVDGMPIECKASIGLAYTEGEERIDALVRQADTALYAAKEQGKGRWTEYNPKQWAPRRTMPDGNHHE